MYFYDVVSKKVGFLDYKNVIFDFGIFPKRLTHDFRQKFKISFESAFL